MKRSLVIVAAVAGYSLIETLLLLSLDIPARDFSPTTWRGIVVLGQLLLIPGMAALMSRIMYGPHRWLRRTITILVAGVLSVPAAIILFMILALPLAWAFDVSRILFDVLLPVVLIAESWGFFTLVRKSGGWSVSDEAHQWLAERQSGTPHRERRMRNRSIRIAVCLPFLVVVLVFLFLPETWAILSRLAPPYSDDLAGYRVSVPATWVVISRSAGESNGFSWLSGLAGRGIARGGNSLRYDWLSAWQVQTRSFDRSETTDYERWPPKASDILGRKEVTIQGETLECIDYLPAYDWGDRNPRRFAHIECSGAGRLRATFDGNRIELPIFYRMLDGITAKR